MAASPTSSVGKKSTNTTSRGSTGSPDDAFNQLAFQHLDPEPWDSTSQDDLFKYEALEDELHIRLLRINHFERLRWTDWAPTQTSDYPCYEMVQVPLDSAPPYTALSYAWGQQTSTHAFKISNAPLPINTSLAAALLRLPRISSTEYLWIDQVCINQADGQEKNHQVQIMGGIYSNAHQVIIWTGGDIAGLQSVVDTCARLRGTKSYWEGSEIGAYPVDFEPLWQLLLQLWFRRAWVIQEAVLAKSAIVAAGSCQLTFDELAQNARWSTFKYSHRDTANPFEDWIMPCFKILNVMYNLRHLPSPPEGLKGRSFDSLIGQHFAATLASNPRDHVYAFLGFLPSDLSISPDYSLSVAGVFRQAARAVMEGTNSLAVLRFLPKDPRCTQLANEDFAQLSSWVPDWSRMSHKRGHGARIFDGRALWVVDFNAANGYPYRPRPSETGHGSELATLGRIIDRITDRRYSKFAGFHEKKPKPRFFGLTDQEATQLDKTALSDSTQSLRKRLVTMYSGGFLYSELETPPESSRYSPDEEEPTVEDVLQRYDQVDPEPCNDNNLEMQFYSHALSLYTFYRPTLTDRNKLGLVPKEARVDDVVVVLHGFKVPIVLRPAGPGTYTVVGQCYLEDAMFGEAVIWAEDEADEFVLV